MTYIHAASYGPDGRRFNALDAENLLSVLDPVIWGGSEGKVSHDVVPHLVFVPSNRDHLERLVNTRRAIEALLLEALEETR